MNGAQPVGDECLAEQTGPGNEDDQKAEIRDAEGQGTAVGQIEGGKQSRPELFRQIGHQGRNEVIGRPDRSEGREVGRKPRRPKTPTAEESRSAKRDQSGASKTRIGEGQRQRDHHGRDADGQHRHRSPWPFFGRLAASTDQRPVVLLAGVGEDHPDHREGQRHEFGSRIEQDHGTEIENAEDHKRHPADRSFDTVLAVPVEEEAVDVTAPDLKKQAEEERRSEVDRRGVVGNPIGDQRKHRLRQNEQSEDGRVEHPPIAEHDPERAMRGSKQRRGADGESEPAEGPRKEIEIDRAPGEHRDQSGEEQH